MVAIVLAMYAPARARTFDESNAACRYNARFWNARAMVRVTGKVTWIGKMTGPVLISVHSAKRWHYLAYMPPFSYLNDLHVMLEKGSTITLEGSLRTAGGEKIVYVSAFTWHGRRHVVRNARGVPRWHTF